MLKKKLNPWMYEGKARSIKITQAKELDRVENDTCSQQLLQEKAKINKMSDVMLQSKTCPFV